MDGPSYIASGLLEVYCELVSSVERWGWGLTDEMIVCPDEKSITRILTRLLMMVTFVWMLSVNNLLEISVERPTCILSGTKHYTPRPQGEPCIHNLHILWADGFVCVPRLTCFLNVTG